MTDHWPRYEVTDDAHLAELCAGWMQREALALDTEFIRTDTFYPRPALMQVGDGEACYLLDCLTLKDLTPLRDLLTQGPLKLLHSCSEDLEVFHHWLGCLPQPLLDTQLAVAMANNEASVGYQRAVENWLGIELEKGETRSDWLKRPLSEAQKHYAALDVAYLLPLWEKLKPQLAQKNLLEAVHQESQQLVDEASQSDEDVPLFLRFKQAWRLNSSQQHLLQQLSLWRDEQARSLNRPRNRVANDALLMQLAETQPTQLRDLEALAPSGWIRRFGSAVLSLAAEAEGQTYTGLPCLNPMDKDYKTEKKRLKAELQQLAEQLDIPAELLARRKWIESWVAQKLSGQTVTLPSTCCAWRSAHLTPLLQAWSTQRGEG